MKMLPLPTHDISKFTISDNKLVAEASSLGVNSTNLYGRLYHDACDIGLHVHNPRTGKTVLFLYTYAMKNSEGETEGWTFSPDHLDVERFPKLAGMKLVILND